MQTLTRCDCDCDCLKAATGRTADEEAREEARAADIVLGRKETEKE